MATQPLLALARMMGNPVIDDETATFIWQGVKPPRMLDDLNNWEAARTFERLGTNLWYTSLHLPLNTYLEYAFFDEESRERIPDPLNPKRVSNGLNNWNHYFYMPKGKPSALAEAQKGVEAGELSTHSVPTNEWITGKERSVSLYRPAVKGAVPLLVVYDGADYLKRAHLDIIADNLIAGRHVRPFAMALIQNGKGARLVEYACSDATLGFLQEAVLPLAREQLDLLPPEKSPWGVLGASMGGLMAMYTGMRMPGVFGNVLSQSGAFRIPGHENFVVSELVRLQPKNKLNIWMDVGRFETLLECNREMHELLESKGYDPTYHEYSGGHNYTAWRNDVGKGLQVIFKPG